MVYQQGDHICTLYASPEEQLQAAVEYIKAGLARGEQCLYVCGEHTPDELRMALDAAGVKVKEEEARAALSLVTKAEAHLKDGRFNASNMISFLHQAVQDALGAGFNGLCAAGDMKWVMDGAPGTEELAEYESCLNDFYASSRALGLCQYNRKSLPPEFLDHCIATHKFVRIEGPIALQNPFYEEPNRAIGRRPASESHIQHKIKTIFAQTPATQMHTPLPSKS
ncbi:MAG TPA: MEDS domain-containing protein [Candidatus Angelobacter sp.]